TGQGGSQQHCHDPGGAPHGGNRSGQSLLVNPRWMHRGRRQQGLPTGSQSWTTARALVSTFSPPERATSSTATRLPSSFSATAPVTTSSAPRPSSGTTTGLAKRTP